jgi:hypothetical protein
MRCDGGALWLALICPHGNDDEYGKPAIITAAGVGGLVGVVRGRRSWRQFQKRCFIL